MSGRPPASGTSMRAANLRGIAAMTLASLLFSANDAFLKLVSAELPPGEIIAIRNGLATLLLVLHGTLAGQLLPWRARAERALVWRTLGELGITFSYLYALFRIPIGLAASILQFGPLAMTAGAALFLGERVGWRRWSATMVGLAGVLLMIGPGSGGLGLPAGLAFLGLLFMTLRELATRGIARDVPATQIALVSVLVVALAALAMALVEHWQAPRGWHVVCLLGSAVVVVSAFLLIIAAMRTGEVSVVAPFRYSYAVGSLALGYVVWHEVPRAPALLGLAIVVGSGLCVLRREQMRG